MTLRSATLPGIGFLPAVCPCRSEHHQRRVPEFVEAVGLPVSEQSPTSSDSGLGSGRSYLTPGELLEWFITPVTVVLAIAVEAGIVTAAS
ncbi:hypothetical protein ACQP1W_43630 [Spirillospora sp. CA-255316]